MSDGRATVPAPTIPGWRTFRSDAGRLWASREVPFADAEQAAGAWRTVDGDDWTELCTSIALQESIAAVAAM